MSRVRPILAWIAAVFVVSFWSAGLNAVFDLRHWIPSADVAGLARYLKFVVLVIAPIVGVIGVLPSYFAIREIKRRSWPRPLSDICAAMAIALLGVCVVVLFLADDSIGAAKVAAYFVCGGALGGLAYWLLAGRPRPLDAGHR